MAGMRPLFRKLVLSTLEPLASGRLELELPDGGVLRYGGLAGRPVARVRVSDENFFRRCVLFGPIGFAESHIAGEWDSPDLAAVIAFFLRNAADSPALEKPGGKKAPFLDIVSAYNRFLHRRRPNSLRISRRNISDHYDLSNDFFRLWLDPTMTYSSAYFDPAGLPLEEAQRKKYDVLCRKLGLSSADHVLEIGTGWGGFSIHAATHFGCRVTTTTISREQLEEARARIAAAGLADRVQVLFEDYRNLTGRFDKIASIEMIEAVGDAFIDGYFERCSHLLKPHGLLGIQGILCPDQQYEVLRRGVDFIQKHIFPGSLLMSAQRLLQASSRTPALNLYNYEDMGPHYARTLHMWLENFDTCLPEVRKLGFDDRFVRKWRYYLAYCEAAFAMRHITVAQLVFTKTGNLSLNAGSPVDGLDYAAARPGSSTLT